VSAHKDLPIPESAREAQMTLVKWLEELEAESNHLSFRSFIRALEELLPDVQNVRNHNEANKGFQSVDTNSRRKDFFA